MTNCEDCIHEHVCYDKRAHGWPYDFNFSDCGCVAFEDKSKTITLPCSIGDYCIYKDRIWSVDVIQYSGEEDDFILWLSMADKSPCGAEAPASEVKFISKEDAKKMLEAGE